MQTYRVIVVGGGHAGAEAAWAAANLLAGRLGEREAAHSVAMVTLDPSKIGVMSCNPAIGGLAKGQIVREVDALGGLMGLAADISGIQFKVLNASKGLAVRGPRAQCDRHAYAEAVQHLIASRPEIDVIAGSVETLLTEDTTSDVPHRIVGVEIAGADGVHRTLRADAVVLTTGTFMRGLMHTGETRTPGGRFGEKAATGISRELERLGFELGRLKTGTPPRLLRSSIDWESLVAQPGDVEPKPFSDLTRVGSECSWSVGDLAMRSFPFLQQVECRQTRTSAAAHDTIRANLHRAPMFSGQIESVGPRYCPSIEDKVVRFADRESHGVFLEPESLRDEIVYCNGIATSTPADVQDAIVRGMPGCEKAEIYRYGYAVEYDMVRPHQIDTTGMTRSVAGFFLAGQINGTSGYEEAAAQGLVAGVNAALWSLHDESQQIWEDVRFTLGRDEAYIGVLMDDLVTRTPTEPYRMFTSRAEHRLLLRSDNSADRLTPRADALGLLLGTQLGAQRLRSFTQRQHNLAQVRKLMASIRIGEVHLERLLRQPEHASIETLRAHLTESFDTSILDTILAEATYSSYIVRQHAEIKRQHEMETRRIPSNLNFAEMRALRNETRQALERFKPQTYGQASRLEGMTPADLSLLMVLVKKAGTESDDSPVCS
ncbi:MAG: tRNA uridine-5-carboxymethylaminomethyl(34) synthesis enzyme MnmG [Phycisphaeraceae bacterium]|nr:tRNA uridine-5-carboxymethylaminomethyl(34) synthesis enzyme MnmG [Phycisphaerales bacterium]MCB9860720.1 tRNA uridine-5-carboxymethylaminomethyl(34) synthesis enzyme MnmG [Phycisphaeraceae bacterium]